MSSNVARRSRTVRALVDRVLTLSVHAGRVRTPRARTRCSLGVILLATLLAPAACSHREPPAAPIDVVVRRFSPAAFGVTDLPAHGPVVKIGDEAREVAVGPRAVEIAALRGIALEDGSARREVELPESARDLPDEAFVLDAQEVPFADRLPDEVFAFFATETFHKRVATRFQLERDPARPGVVQLAMTPAEVKPNVQFNLDLRALLPQPAAVESDAFTIPRNASLSLGYGVSEDVATTGGPAIRFRAVLVCDGKEPLPLLEDTISPDDAAGWRDRRVPVEAGAPCRLRLESATPDGGTVRTAAWSEPLLLAPQSPQSRPQAESVILISLDTLRGDHLSGFGYPRATSPNIDAQMIARGTSFTDSITTFPRTDVAHLSLFTGLFPEAQPAAGRLRATATATMLTESLRDAGMITAGFTEDAMIAGAFGFWFGFDRFVERSYAERERGHRTFADGIDFVRAHAGERFFLFLHTYKTHKPYLTDERLASFADPSDWDRLPLDDRIPPAERPNVDAYDRTIREADELMAKLLAELARLGISERTLVVLLSDHGEAFGEHGSLEHGYAGHQEQLNIPLVFRGPGVPANVRVETPASIADVAPTVLELAGAAPLPGAQGLSLAPAFAGRSLPRARPLFFSWLAEGARGVRHGQWKYLRADHGHELFDLAADPEERLPRLRRRSPRAVDAGLLDDYVASSARLRERFNAATPKDAADAAISDQMQESLRALGYVD